MRLKSIAAPIIALIFCGNTLVGCAHKMEIRQGNVLSGEIIDQLKPGMSTAQVEFLLGPPSITDTFHANRWDYVYSIEKNAKRGEPNHLILYFKGDELDRIERSTAKPLL